MKNSQKQTWRRHRVPPNKTDSVRFHYIGDIEFWCSPTNQIFLVQGDNVITPHLHGNTVVTFDRADIPLSDLVRAKCLVLLKKQRQIREHPDYISPEEEKEVFNWS
jgi:hypothetical protein